MTLLLFAAVSATGLACGAGGRDGRIPVICYGDSITWAARFEWNRWSAHLQERLDDWRPDTYRVINRGHSGATSSRAVDRVLGAVIPDLPGVVLLQFGYNDANVRDGMTQPRVSVSEYARNLRVLHDTIRAHGGTPVFVVNHSIGAATRAQGNGRTWSENHAPYHEALQAAIGRLRTPSIDIPARLAGAGRSTADLVGSDGVHLSDPGMSLYGDLVFEGLVAALSELGAPPGPGRAPLR